MFTQMFVNQKVNNIYNYNINSIGREENGKTNQHHLKRSMMISN